MPPRTASSRRRATPVAALVPAFTGFSVSQEAPVLPPAPRTVAARSALTASLRRPATAPTQRMSFMTSVEILFKQLLETGDVDKIDSFISNADFKLLQSTDPEGNTLFHYLANNPNLKANDYTSLLDGLESEVHFVNTRYTPNRANRTPFMVALKRKAPIEVLTVFLNEEKGSHGKIHTPVMVAALPEITADLLNYDALSSPVSVGINIPNATNKRKNLVQLFHKVLQHVGFSLENQPAITETLKVLLDAYNTTQETNKKAFIKDLAKPLFHGKTPLPGKTRDDYGVLQSGGKKKAAKAKP